MKPTAKSKLSATEGTFIVVLQNFSSNLPLRRWLSNSYATAGLLPLLRPFVVSSLGASQPLLWRSTPLGYCLPVHLTGQVFHILHPFPLSSLRRLLPRLTLMPMHSCHCLRVSLTLLYFFTLTLLCFFTLTLPLKSRSAMLHPLVLARAVSPWPQHGARQQSSCGSSVAT